MMKGPEGQRKRITPGFWGNTKICNKDYCWGTCSFSHPLPQEKGIYNYTIIVLDSPKGTFSQQVIIRVKISKCAINKIALYRDAPEPITCTNLTRDGANIWRHHDDNHIIGECTAEGNCTNYFKETYGISRRAQSTESQLVIFSNFTDLKADRITCEDKGNNNSHSCVLVIKHHPSLRKCRVDVSATSGYVSGSCFADNIFTSDGLYACDWRVKSPEGKVSGKKPGFWGNTMSCKGDHCWGTCSFSHPQPQEKGLYTYTIMVLNSDRGVYSQNISIDGSLSDDKHANHVNRIIGVLVPVTIVTAAVITLIVVVTKRRNQIKNVEQPINLPEAPTAEDARNYSREQNGRICREDDTDCYHVVCDAIDIDYEIVDDCYHVVCDAIDIDYEIVDDKNPYDRIFDDTNSSENSLSLHSEKQPTDLEVNV
ncbi:uncharacterized protein LOC112568189 [Pomacea canaliculata]|uniref:uncharacterized protein LOC112568189 n=1 Tax=Pomacea canaliculata TaxID=400727 RepID=UPI000D734B16|nr:uncharacterized protein LOC112568189 [Pomacea canaliculata]